MNKAKLDYDWVWDTLFFGRGFMETLRFNKKRKLMEPAVINPLVFGYDPYFEEVQDWRYYWKWLTKNRHDLEKLIEAGVITGIKSPDEIESGMETYLWDYKIRRDSAKKGVAQATNTQMGDVFQILEYFGINDKGEKCVYWTDKGFSKILFEMKLDLQDGEEIVAPDDTVIENGSRWPIVVKEAFREPHSSLTFSVADLLEDKHRAKSVLLNLAFLAAKDKANPTYLYNPDLVKDITQFFNRQIDQHIPVEDVEKAVQPLNTENPMDPGLVSFITMLQQEANEPLGTGVEAQPQKGAPPTATSAAIDQQLDDIAQSLQSKVMQFGESEFWSHWFHRYKRYGADLGTKMANIVGVKGLKTDMVNLKDFNTDYPPGVLVYSAKEAEYKDLVLRRDLINLYPQLQQSLGPAGMKNFNKHIFFPKFLHDPSLIDMLFPDSIDEIKAKEENEVLAKNEFPQVLPTDDHLAHIYTHYMVQPKTNATWFHIAEHQDYLAKQKYAMLKQQMMQPQPGQQQPQSTNQPINQDRLNPQSAAAPLQAETQSTPQSQQQNGQ